MNPFDIFERPGSDIPQYEPQDMTTSLENTTDPSSWGQEAPEHTTSLDLVNSSLDPLEGYENPDSHAYESIHEQIGHLGQMEIGFGAEPKTIASSNFDSAYSANFDAIEDPQILDIGYEDPQSLIHEASVRFAAHN